MSHLKMIVYDGLAANEGGTSLHAKNPISQSVYYCVDKTQLFNLTCTELCLEKNVLLSQAIC